MTGDWDNIEIPTKPTEEEKRALLEKANRKREEIIKKHPEDIIDDSTEWIEDNPLENVVLGSDLILKELPEIDWVIEGILPNHGITILGGDSGSYKTFLALHIGICICHGLKVFNNFKTKKGKVLYVDEENCLSIMQRRLFQLFNNDTLELEDIGFLFYKGVKLENNDLWKRRLDELIMKFQPRAIIIDSLVRTLTGNENDVTDVRKVFDTLKEFKHKYDVAFLLLHHTRKRTGYYSNKDDLRGSGDFSAFADVVCMINKHEEGLLSLSQSKNRLQLPIFNCGIKVIDKDEKLIEFEHVKLTNDKTMAKCELCAKDIEDWIIKENKQKFKTSEAENAMKSKHARNAIFDALELLKDKEVLIKPTHGVYEYAKKLEITQNLDDPNKLIKF